VVRSTMTRSFRPAPAAALLAVLAGYGPAVAVRGDAGGAPAEVPAKAFLFDPALFATKRPAARAEG
jgi:hypothetical protein